MKEKYWVIEQENISPKNREAANEYLLDQKLDGEHSIATIDRYRRVLETLFSECPKNFDEMAPEDVKAWLDAHDKYKARTIYLVLSVISDFSNFCQEEGYLDHRLMKSRWFPNLPDSLPMYLDSHEFARVRLHAEDMPLRDRALLSFLFSSGCRRAEASGLNAEDVDLENGTATVVGKAVVGKGAGRRLVHFNEETALLLKKYLSSRRGDDPALFHNKYGKRLGPIAIYVITRRLGKKSGLRLSPHRCRHTFATNLLSRGATLEFIKDELGHKKINTTLIYARVPSPELISEYRRIME